jgi:hypothetical protein
MKVEVYSLPLDTLTTLTGEKQFDRGYLLEQFPNYDYRFPKEPWKLDYRQKENRLLVQFQIQAFHYWWVLEQTRLSGGIGYAINTPYLPHTLNVDRSYLDDPLLKNQDCRVIICSAALPFFSCYNPNTRCTQATCLLYAFEDMLNLLAPGGILAGVIFDEEHASREGASFHQAHIERGADQDAAIFQHAWTAAEFLKILENIQAKYKTEERQFTIEEYDTLKNNFACNFVLRKP